MKKLLTVLAMCAAVAPAFASDATIGRKDYGSGIPGESGFENATSVSNDIFHAPQFLPGYPTAATIYPRVVEVDCEAKQGGVECQGYNWSPNMGRGEYLFVKPRVKEPTTPIVIERKVEVIKEVPAKKIRE